MNEKGLKILEQYDLKVYHTRRGRGSFICETDQGLKLIMEFNGSKKRLQFQNRVLQHLKEQGQVLVDQVVENMEGELVTVDRDETAYLVKDWFEGKECDARNEEEVFGAVRTLARLHCLLRLPIQEEEGQYIGPSLVEEYARKNREMKKVYQFIRGRRQKNEFEICFLNNYAMFYDQAKETERFLLSSESEALRTESLEQGLLCHGDYNQHQVLNCRQGMAVTNFDKCRFDVQVGDLYQFMRKILEKQDWNPRLGLALVEEYDRIRTLSRREREELKLRIAYPEKFWKLSNYYFNRNKAWIPGKNVEKLETLAAQQEKRCSFMKILDL